MKKALLSILSGVILIVVAVSCSEKDKAEKFSTATVEENKAKVEKTGTDMISVMQKFENLQTVEVLANLIDITGAAKGSQFLRNSRLYPVFEAMASKQPGTKKVNSIFNGVNNLCKSSEPESIQQWWNDNVGTYNWNTSLGDWDISLGGTKMIFKFPGSSSATSNTATITISNYTGVTFTVPLDEDYTGDFPATINMDLKVGTTTLVTLVAGATYYTDGVPKSAAADLTVENFKFEADVSNDTKVISATYKFLDGNDVIMNFSASGAGLFTKKNYDDNTSTHTETYTYIYDYQWNPVTQQWDPLYATWTDEWEETEFEEIINSANAEFNIFNLAIKGEIDIKGLEDQLRIIDAARDNDEITSETQDTRYAQQINKYLNLRLINTESNEIIAKVEAYVVHESDQYDEWTYVNFRFVFGDDSRIDLETYFDNGFDSFVAQLNSLIDDINADYNTDIDPVEY